MNYTLSLQSLFHDRVFRIPDYQRGYAWERQQIEEFLSDLDLLGSARRHYTGTVVLYQTTGASERRDNEGGTYTQVDIVDGQQRLTTIVLLLNEICRALSGYEESQGLSVGIRKNYIEATDIDNQPLYKLSLNEDTNSFWVSNILPTQPSPEGPRITSEQRLASAKRQISEYLHAVQRSKENGEQWLRDLSAKVTHQLHFSLYQVEKAAEVGVIFEVMNDRGKSLTDLEKVKNYLLYAAASLDDLEDANRENFAGLVNNAWAEILRNLMSAGLTQPANEDQLLRAHWLMQYDPQSRKWQGSRSIRTRFDLREYRNRHSELLSDLTQYVESLRIACICFCDALRPTRGVAFSSFSNRPTIRRDIVLWNSRLVRVRVVATFLPLLMAVRMRWSEPEKYLEVVKLCELLAFRIYRVAQNNSNYREPAMSRLAYEVSQGLEFEDVLSEIREQYNDRYARRRFDEFMDPSEPSGLYEWPGLKYFLYEYEQHLAAGKGAPPRVTWNEIALVGLQDSIEHVLPQSIYNQPYWLDRFNGNVHWEYLHDIGNLCLTKHNSFYSNKPFPEKKGSLDSERRCYATSPLFQEQELALWDDWTTDAIDQRRARLFDWARRRWHVDFGDARGSAEWEDDDDYETEEGE